MKKGLGLVLVLFFAASAFAQAAHSVTLTWTASTDTLAGIGYNVYRGTASGAESSTPLNSSPVALNCSGATCTYTDTAVVAATTYFYVVRAVVGSVQSVPSNEASCTVPLGPPSSLTATAQ